MKESLPKGYKPWIVASVAVLVLSLMMLAIAVTEAFVAFQQSSTPLWVVALGAVAVFGIFAGFGGLFLLMAVAGYKTFREARKVQVLPPEHPAHDGPAPPSAG